MAEPILDVRHLISVVQELSLARDLPAVMAIVRTAARRLTGADGATFVLRDSGRCYYADEDAISPLWKGQRFPMEACISGWSMLHREAVAIPDIYADPRIPTDAYRPTFVKSLVMVPIRTAAPVGAIGTYWAHRHLATDAEIDLLSTLANSTSIAMENVQLYAELEQRVVQRTADLVRVQRQKDELAQLIVHDLRSPASGIMLASRVRLRDGQASEAERRRWQAVHTSAEAIHRMAMNLLDVMRSEDGTFAPRFGERATAKLVSDAFEQMAPLADASGRTLVLDARELPPAIACDEEGVRRLLQNLIDNAIRHSPEGGTVTLRAARAGDDLELRVIDDGPGIPAAQRAAVFERGVQLASAHPSGHSGRGLGLAFCRLAAESHGGTITIEDNQPAGSVFVVRLPVARAA
ncbi:MAG TPA: ATP-binding protein [Kofleriaceae bacterium]|nr:ATP-binding protein [Kofleriaceae bacterium]